MLSFVKMHGLGNDFVVIDAFSRPLALGREQIRRLADRRYGIGCDQLLLVEPASGDADFRYRIYNADGSEAEMCGNGARAFARFVHDQGLSQSKRLRLETGAGLVETRLLEGGEVMVNMGPPRFEPARIPFLAPQESLDYQLDIDGQQYEIGVLSMGNPHALLRVESVDSAPVAVVGAAIERHERFPARVNVGFMQVEERNALRLRVYERGAGETLACGTNACAAVVHGRRMGWLDSQVVVTLPGGSVVVSWEGNGEDVWLTGPAHYVFRGEIEP